MINIQKVDINDLNFTELIRPAMSSGYMGGIAQGVNWYKSNTDLNGGVNPSFILEFSGITVPLQADYLYGYAFAWFGVSVLQSQRRAYSSAGNTTVLYCDIPEYAEESDWVGQYWDFATMTPVTLVAGRVYDTVKFCFPFANFQRKYMAIVEKPSILLNLVSTLPGIPLKEAIGMAMVDYQLDPTIDYKAVELEPGYMILRPTTTPIEAFILAERLET